MENIVNTKKLYDKDFRRELMENPKEVVLELGLKLENDVEIKVVENTKNNYYIAIPLVTKDIAITELENLDAAGSFSSVGSFGSVGGSASSFATASSYGGN